RRARPWRRTRPATGFAEKGFGMSGSRLALGGILCVLIGCGSVFGVAEEEEADGDGTLPEGPPGSATLPPGERPEPPDKKPSDAELNENFAVFVAESGSDEAEGTRASPLATIAAGIARALPNGKRVAVCAGSYVGE